MDEVLWRAPAPGVTDEEATRALFDRHYARRLRDEQNGPVMPVTLWGFMQVEESRRWWPRLRSYWSSSSKAP